MKKVAIAVGQFIHRKGFDVLLKAWAECDKDYELYIIGAQPTTEYIELKQALNLENVHFEGFKTKAELQQYYQAADLFILPTREDIWGLVVNEAMASGLPVITTDKCVAGLELIKNGESGYVIPSENTVLLTEKINLILRDDSMRQRMAENALNTIRKYTIENMAKSHIEVLE